MSQIFSTRKVPARRLWKDPYLLAALAAIVLVSIPLLLGLPGSFWTNVYPFYFDAPLLALTALVLWQARRSAQRDRAKKFWQTLSLGFCCWFFVRLVDPFLSGNTRTLVIDLVYLAFYLFLITALQMRPHQQRHDKNAHLIQQLESTSATLLAFGLLVYFVVLPAAFNPSALVTNVPSITLYVALNLYLFSRAFALRSSWQRNPWRGCYDWLVAATALFVLLDGFDLLTRINQTIDAALKGTLFEALWLLPMLGFIAAARLYTLSASDHRSASPDRSVDSLVWRWRGRLTYYALIPPTVHIALEVLGLADEATRPARQILIILWVATAAALSMLYDRRLLQRQQAVDRRHRDVNQQLEVAQRMDAVRRMAGGIAHDFNNLLMVIQGFAEVLVSKLEDKEDKSDAEQISNAAKRAGKLTSQLVTIGAKEKRGIQAFLPNQVLRAMTPTLERLVGSHLTFGIDLQETGYVLGDRGAFEDAVLNLVLNARDASNDGGLISLSSGKVLVANGGLLADTLGPGSYGYVRVEDQGRGMDEETRRHVFEPFYTKKATGTGLGLSMVYAFAREAGGTVEVHSREGEGTQFRIILPESYPPGELESGEYEASEILRSARTVLLVEDEESVRRVLKQSLERSGLQVLEACNGEEGLQVLRHTAMKIDLVVTDVVMPEMDGGTMAQKIQELDPSMPIIFMTGYAAGQLDRLGSWADTAPILRKPFAAKKLLREIERTLSPTPIH